MLTVPEGRPLTQRSACYFARRDGMRPWAAEGYDAIMKSTQIARDSLPDHEQKQAALDLLQEAWVEARLYGVDGDCMAQICLFTAFSELVSTYGEDATARY